MMAARSRAPAWLAVGCHAHPSCLQEFHRSVLCCGSASVQLRCALAVCGIDLLAQLFGLFLEVALLCRASWDVASFLLVSLVGVHCEAPWLIHAAIWVPAIVVVAK